jgi:hypothetical protein
VEPTQDELRAAVVKARRAWERKTGKAEKLEAEGRRAFCEALAAVDDAGGSVSAAARAAGLSRGYTHRLLAGYRQEQGAARDGA